ncbi:hypothetical protein ACFL2V_19230, partial [Pseudomonadota bacterium]
MRRVIFLSVVVLLTLSAMLTLPAAVGVTQACGHEPTPAPTTEPEVTPETPVEEEEETEEEIPTPGEEEEVEDDSSPVPVNPPRSNNNDDGVAVPEPTHWDWFITNHPYSDCTDILMWNEYQAPLGMWMSSYYWPVGLDTFQNRTTPGITEWRLFAVREISGVRQAVMAIYWPENGDE